MAKMMDALVKKYAKPGLWLEKVPFPEMKEGEVLVKIRKTAICGTDVHIYDWDKWSQETIPVPMTIGHEFVGEIVAIENNKIKVKYFFKITLIKLSYTR